jgi:nucleoside-diphosphate-sugar epimerase
MTDRAAPRLPPDCAAPLAGRTLLVTGATGFVGQHVVRALLASEGIAVRILARSPDRARDVFGPAVQSIDVRRGDLADASSLGGLCEGVDFVIHAGSVVPYASADAAARDAFARVNVLGTELLAQEALRSGVRRWVQVSSTAAMGTPREADVDETTPCRPASAYQLSKHASEQALARLQRERGLDVAIVRPCLVAGEGKRGGELLKLFRLCARGIFPVVGGRLEVEKPLVDVDDLAQALLLAAVRGPGGGVYLVHSGVRHTLGTILEAAGRIVGNRRPYLSIPFPLARAAAQVGTFGSRLLGRQLPLTRERLDLFLMDRRIDIAKARDVLGYLPRHTDVGLMLRRTYDDYRATGQL